MPTALAEIARVRSSPAQERRPPAGAKAKAKAAAVPAAAAEAARRVLLVVGVRQSVN